MATLEEYREASYNGNHMQISVMAYGDGLHRKNSDDAIYNYIRQDLRDFYTRLIPFVCTNRKHHPVREKEFRRMLALAPSFVDLLVHLLMEFPLLDVSMEACYGDPELPLWGVEEYMDVSNYNLTLTLDAGCEENHFYLDEKSGLSIPIRKIRVEKWCPTSSGDKIVFVGEQCDICYYSIAIDGGRLRGVTPCADALDLDRRINYDAAEVAFHKRMKQLRSYGRK